jgi:polyvinyl alcohol dehydrogenase (cytochrome)
VQTRSSSAARSAVALIVAAVVTVLAAACTSGSGGTGADPSPTSPGTTTAPPGTAVALDDQWRVFGHDHANTRDAATETKLSPTNVSGLQPAWRMDGLTGQTSTPAVVDGVVYFGDWTGKVHAVRAADGRPVWERQFNTDQINDSPLVTDDTVYVADGEANFHALDRSTGADRVPCTSTATPTRASTRRRC